MSFRFLAIATTLLITQGACSPLRAADAGLDASDSPDAVDDFETATDSVEDTVGTVDATAWCDSGPTVVNDSGLVCGFYRTPCDPIANTGCDGGMRCGIVSWTMPFSAGCSMPGAAVEGEQCTTTLDCAAGLHCLRGSCIRGCCPYSSSGDSQCASGGDPRVPSECAVRVDSSAVYGCTLAGVCNYHDPASCPSGLRCYPRSALGYGDCLNVGTVGEDGACTAQSECLPAMNCVIAPGADAGVCKPVCDPHRPCSNPSNCSCRLFGDLPSDYGYCTH